MKKILCYLGILICFVLVIFPLALRIFLPNKKEEVKEEVKERVILSCSNEEYTIANSYNGNDIDMIVIRRLKGDFSITGENLTNLFNELRLKNEVSYKETDESEMISIDFALSKHDNLNINTIKEDINKVREWYEQENLVCEIRK